MVFFVNLSDLGTGDGWLLVGAYRVIPLCFGRVRGSFLIE